MALKDNWIDKTNDQDYVVAEDINKIANAVIGLEEQAENGTGGGSSGEAPTFDLIELGMPTIGVDAGFVGISCDTTEMREALDKGAVQFKVKLGELSGEGEYEATILMGSIETETEGSKFTCSCRVSGSYVLDGEFSTSSVAELTIVVIEGGVMAVMSHLLHVPPVDEASNGKILQVVDGEWTVVTVADSSIKTYIDDYINEALGGDY